MPGVKTRGSASKRALMTGIAAVVLAGTVPAVTIPGRTDNASVTGLQGDLVNRPGCWTENGYDREVPCTVVRGGPGL